MRPAALALTAAALAAASLAHAAIAGAGVERHAVTLRSGVATVVPRAGRFELAGVHWSGPGSVEVRARSAGGRWGPWRNAAPEAEDAPDGTRRVHVGNPLWTGPADRLQARASGRVHGVRVFLVRPAAGPPAPRAVATAAAPPIVTRSAWGANESLRRAAPEYARAVRYAVVHHTAGASSYTRAQAPAIVRSILEYHVRGNGWNDIGYNFLVDRFGQVYEGRWGGMTRAVVGAHAQGFNTGSVGIAVIGTYGSAAPSPAAQDALARLIAWRLDVAHVDPASTLTVTSGGNPRFGPGVPVFLRTVSGHRDTGFTDCPGDALEARLTPLARTAAGIGAPKVFSPGVAGAVGGTVRFTARLSAELPWTVTVTDAARAVVATGSGTGAAVDWTWDATAAPQARYLWSISTPGARAATGALGSGGEVPLAITAARAVPAAVTPNGDGRDDVTTVRYSLSRPATVSARLLDAEGRPLAFLFSADQPAGQQRFTFAPESVADGTYRLVLTAVAGARQAQTSVELLVSRTLSGFALAPAAFSPNRDGLADAVTFRWTLAVAAEARIRILLRGKVVATPFAGPLEAGAQQVVWDGSKPGGRLLDGAYVAEVRVTDAVGTVALRLPLRADTRPPRLGLLSRRPLRVRVSEPATLVVSAGGPAVKVPVARPGAVRLPVPPSAARVRVVAWDRAGNRAAVSYRR